MSYLPALFQRREPVGHCAPAVDLITAESQSRSYHQKHLEEAAHRLGQNEGPLREAVGPTGPASGLTLYSCRTGTRETNRHHRPDSIHDRPSLRPENLRIIVAMHVDKLVRTGLRISRILNNFRKPNSATTFLQAYKPYLWGIRDILDKIGICSDRNTVPK